MCYIICMHGKPSAELEIRHTAVRGCGKLDMCFVPETIYEYTENKQAHMIYLLYDAIFFILFRFTLVHVSLINASTCECCFSTLILQNP